MNAKSIGEKIATRRKELGMTQLDIAIGTIRVFAVLNIPSAIWLWRLFRKVKS